MTALTIEDRFPLQTQRGNFSGKASAFIKSLIPGYWWTADPANGGVPHTMERNAQFHLNQGPVDMEIMNARPTFTPSSLDSESTLTGTYLHRTLGKKMYDPEKETNASGWKEYFIWHTGRKPSSLTFSTIPTKY